MRRMVMAAGLAAGIAVQADTTTVRGPVLGYVLDSRTQAVRPINGIPGATHLGGPLALGFPVSQAVFSSRGDFGVVVATEGGAVYRVSIAGGVVELTQIAGAIRPSRLAVNAADTAVLLYSAEPRRVQVVRGAAAGPVVELPGLSGIVTALALDGGGREALLGVSEGGRGALLRISLPDQGDAGETRIGEARAVGLFAEPLAVALLNRDRDAVVADAGSNRVFLLRDFAGEAAQEALLAERDGVAQPVGVEASADGRRIYVANGAGSGSVLVLDLETRTLEIRATLEGAPTRLDRLQGRQSFLLNEPGEAPLLILDHTENPEVYFVPADRNN